MAASVLLTIGPQPELLRKIVEKAKLIQPGQTSGPVMGPVIDSPSLDKITRYITQSEQSGAQVLLDGRQWTATHSSTGGHWIGPTVLLHSNKSDSALHDEIFGPVISILQVESKEEAVEIENACPYGNAGALLPSSF